MESWSEIVRGSFSSIAGVLLRLDRLMNLHEASRRYAGSPLKNDGRKTAASNVARSPGAEDIERPFPLRECFPLGGFQLERRARTAVGLDRRRRTRIWRSMKARQPVRNAANDRAQIALYFNLSHARI